MNNIRTIIPACMASLTMASCVYGPHIAHVPIYEQQGDMQVSGSLSVWDGLSASAGVALTDHVAMQTVLSVIPVNGIISTQTALGYYKAFENHTMLGLYGGYGNANGYEAVETNPDEGGGLALRHLFDNRFFLQVDYGWLEQERWGIACRLTSGYLQKEGYFFLEPALDIPMLTGPFRLDLRFSWLMLKQLNTTGGFFSIPNVGLGVSYNFKLKK